MGKSKYVFFTDSLGLDTCLPIMKSLEGEDTPFEVHYVKQKDIKNIEHLSEAINRILSKQKVGTFLYCFGDWSVVKKVKNMALDIGFTENEMKMEALNYTV
jgi:hypothetical protein